MSASGQCPHPDVHIDLNHARCGDSNTHHLEIKILCKVCRASMAFPCRDMGLSPNHPATSPDGLEIRLPFRGEGEEPTGSQLGFTIKGTSS